MKKIVKLGKRKSSSVNTALYKKVLKNLLLREEDG